MRVPTYKDLHSRVHTSKSSSGADLSRMAQNPKISAALLWVKLISVVLTILLFTCLMLQAATPDASIYQSYIPMHVLLAVFLARTWKIAYYKHFDDTVDTAIIGVLTLLFGIVAIADIYNEVSNCWSINSDILNAIGQCNSLYSNTAVSDSTISAACTIAGRSNIAKCVAGHVSASNIKRAQVAGAAAGFIVGTEMALVAVITVILASQFWSLSVRILEDKSSQVIWLASQPVCQEWPLKGRFDALLAYLEGRRPSDSGKTE